MRLPWWPIYVEAEMTESGARYSTPDGVIHFAQVDQLLPQTQWKASRVFWVLNKRLRKLRYRRCLINLRLDTDAANLISQIEAKKPVEFDIDPDVIARQNKKCVWIMFSGLCILPACMLLLFFLLPSTSSPTSPEGKKIQVGFLILNAIMLLIIFGAAILSMRQLRFISHAKRLTGVTHDGISYCDPDGSGGFISDSDLQPPSASWGIVSASSLQGHVVLLPHMNTIHRQIIKCRTSPAPQPSWKVTLWIAIPLILSGPLFYMWNRYLIPDEPITKEPLRYLSLMGLGLFFIFNTLAIRWWRKREKKCNTSLSQ